MLRLFWGIRGLFMERGFWALPAAVGGAVASCAGVDMRRAGRKREQRYGGKTWRTLPGGRTRACAKRRARMQTGPNDASAPCRGEDPRMRNTLPSLGDPEIPKFFPLFGGH